MYLHWRLRLRLSFHFIYYSIVTEIFTGYGFSNVKPRYRKSENPRGKPNYEPYVKRDTYSRQRSRSRSRERYNSRKDTSYDSAKIAQTTTRNEIVDQSRFTVPPPTISTTPANATSVGPCGPPSQPMTAPMPGAPPLPHYPYYYSIPPPPPPPTPTSQANSGNPPLPNQPPPPLPGRPQQCIPYGYYPPYMPNYGYAPGYVPQ